MNKLNSNIFANNNVMKIRLLLSISLLAIVTFAIKSQQCENIEKKCPDPHKSFKLSASSRSFALKKGSKTTISINAMGGRDYFISVFSRGKVDDVQFKIIGGDTNNRKVLYDNAAVGFSNQKTITMVNTQKIIIEISAPKTKFDKGESECAGIKIAYRKTP